MVCLGSLPQILLGPFVNTLSQVTFLKRQVAIPEANEAAFFRMFSEDIIYIYVSLKNMKEVLSNRCYYPSYSVLQTYPALL